MTDATTGPMGGRPGRLRLGRAAGFGLVLGGMVGRGFAHWFLIWIIARAYGAADLGAYSVILAGATPIYVVVALALRDVYVSLGDRPSWGAFALGRVIGVVAGAALLALYCALVAPMWGLNAAMVAMESADGILEIFSARVQERRRFSLLGDLSIINAVVSIAAIVAVAATGAGVVWLLVATAVVSMLMCIPAWVLSSDPRAGAEPDAGAWGRVLRAAIPMTVLTSIMSVVSSIPVWFLDRYASRDEVGAFSAVAYLIVAGNMVGAAVQTVLIPRYQAALHTGGMGLLIRRSARDVVVLSAVGSLLVLVVVFAGDPVLIAVYGAGFGATKLALLGFGIASLFAVLSYVNAAVLLASNKYLVQMHSAIAALVGAVIPPVASVMAGGRQLMLAAVSSLVLAYVARYASAAVLLHLGDRKQERESAAARSDAREEQLR